MLDIKKLEINKLFKEFEYVKSDYEYKSEIVREADIEFLKNIDTILDKNAELKSIYNDKVNIKLKKNIEKRTQDIHIEESNIVEPEVEATIEEDDYQKDTRPNKIKILYRQIAKITHPDKVEQKRLNTLYIEASKFYNENDIIGIYKICDELYIPYEVEDDDIDLVKENISIIRDRISFLESTFTWKWINESNDNKNELILKYIRSQIIGIKN
jgi:hypothetical protein